MKRVKAKVDKTGKKAYEQYVKITRKMLHNPAFIAMSCTAKVLYLHIKMEAYGDRNGKVRLSIAAAAHVLGVSANTANKAFHELQAKGLAVLTSFGTLGLEGTRSSPTYGVTEYPLPNEVVPRMSYLNWRDDHDFPIMRHGANNPSGWNGTTHLKV